MKVHHVIIPWDMHLEIVQKLCKYIFQVKRKSPVAPHWGIAKKNSPDDFTTVQSSGD